MIYRWIPILLVILNFSLANASPEKSEFSQKEDTSFSQDLPMLSKHNDYSSIQPKLEEKIFPLLVKKVNEVFLDDCKNLEQNTEKFNTEVRKEEFLSSACSDVLSNFNFQSTEVREKFNYWCNFQVRDKLSYRALTNHFDSCDKLAESGKYENNKVHLIFSIVEDFTCKASFEIINKTSKTISANTIVGQITGADPNPLYPYDKGYDAIDHLVAFEKLLPGESKKGYVKLKYGYCAQIGQIRKVGFSNMNNALKDGFTSYKIFQVHSKVEPKKTWEFNQQYLDEFIRLQNPNYRKLIEKINICLNSCQSKAISCVLKYKSAANEICGMPNFYCIQGCNAMRTNFLKDLKDK